MDSKVYSNMKSKLKQSNDINFTSSSYVLEKSTAEKTGQKIKKLHNKTMASVLKGSKPTEQR